MVCSISNSSAGSGQILSQEFRNIAPAGVYTNFVSGLLVYSCMNLKKTFFFCMCRDSTFSTAERVTSPVFLSMIR